MTNRHVVREQHCKEFQTYKTLVDTYRGEWLKCFEYTVKKYGRHTMPIAGHDARAAAAKSFVKNGHMLKYTFLYNKDGMISKGVVMFDLKHGEVIEAGGRDR